MGLKHGDEVNPSRITPRTNRTTVGLKPDGLVGVLLWKVGTNRTTVGLKPLRQGRFP